MRTEAVSTTTLTTTRTTPPEISTRSQRLWRYLPLTLCLLLTIGIRTWLAIRTQGFVDGDEALVGVQAQHILRGELPVYYYGQPYMGSLEAYLIALLFALFGFSTWVMRAEPILLSLVLVWLSWRLAGALATEACLSEQARSWFIIVSTTFAAIPPLYDGVVEMRAWGGHVETYLITLLLLLSALRLTQRWREGATPRETAWRWAGIGLLVGLGLWVYPVSIFAVLTAALWIAGTCALALLQRRKQKAQSEQTTSSAQVWQRLALVVTAIPSFLLGFAPALLWGATHQWTNILYLVSPNNNDSQSALLHHLYPNRLALLRGTITLYGRCVAPRVIGGALPSVPLNTTLLEASVGIAVIAVSAFLVILAFFRRTALLESVQRLAGLPLLFMLITTLVFCGSSISAAGLFLPCTRDSVGRYAVPLALALPYLFAVLVTAAYLYISELAVPLRTSKRFLGGRPKLVQAILLVFVAIYLMAQALPYARANPYYTFQSSACQIAPIDNTAIVDYMQREHIRYAWGTMWLANLIVFKTNSQILVVDPRIVTAQADNRVPANTAAVQRAVRPSILIFAAHSDAHPDLLRSLDDQGVTYKIGRFPATPGMDVLVVMPDRTVSPDTANSLGSWFYNC